MQDGKKEEVEEALLRGCVGRRNCATHQEHLQDGPGRRENEGSRRPSSVIDKCQWFDLTEEEFADVTHQDSPNDSDGASEADDADGAVSADIADDTNGVDGAHDADRGLGNPWARHLDPGPNADHAQQAEHLAALAH